MKTTRRILALLSFVALAGTLLAVGVVGRWKGKIILDASKMPKAQSGQQQQQMDAGLAQIKKMVVTLELKPNKTYVADAKNLPGKKAPEYNEGTWKQEGNTLWLTSTKSNGKPTTDKKPQKFLITENGKKLVLAQPGMPEFMSIVFTR